MNPECRPLRPIGNHAASASGYTCPLPCGTRANTAAGKAAVQRVQMLDGKLRLLNNVADLGVRAIINRYKRLAGMARGLRVLLLIGFVLPVLMRKVVQPKKLREAMSDQEGP